MIGFDPVRLLPTCMCSAPESSDTSQIDATIAYRSQYFSYVHLLVVYFVRVLSVVDVGEHSRGIRSAKAGRIRGLL